MAESSRTLYVGLDVHKDALAVAYAPDGADDLTNRDAHHRQYVSGPLTAQTLSGNVKAQIQGLETFNNDNLYLTLMLRMGIVGMAAFLWIFIWGLWIAYGLFRRTKDLRVQQFCATFVAIYAAMLVYGLADATMLSNRLTFLHATFLGILARLGGEEKDGDPS